VGGELGRVGDIQAKRISTTPLNFCCISADNEDHRVILPAVFRVLARIGIGNAEIVDSFDNRKLHLELMIITLLPVVVGLVAYHAW